MSLSKMRSATDECWSQAVIQFLLVRIAVPLVRNKTTSPKRELEVDSGRSTLAGRPIPTCGCGGCARPRLGFDPFI